MESNVVLTPLAINKDLIKRDANTEPEKIFDALTSFAYVQARRRVFRQLLQALIYEETIRFEEKHDGDDIEFSISGKDESGRDVVYRCIGRRRYSFGRIRLNEKPVIRETGNQHYEAGSVSLMLDEIRGAFTVFPEYLGRFQNELEQTVLKDAMSLYDQGQDQHCLRKGVYDDVECRLSDGHPYHPCYKSRIGFDYLDNWKFAPEITPVIKPIWLAVHKEYSHLSATVDTDYSSLLLEELGERQLQEFQAAILASGKVVDEYRLLPVHPWQWRQVVVQDYAWDLHNRNIIFLGEGIDSYRPQQSIRTLANFTDPEKSYLKLALNITNTSTRRGLADHTVANTALISSWLKIIVNSDNYLNLELNPVILGEIVAVSYQSRQSLAPAGSLACIWRESLHNYMDVEESALPFSALTSIDRDGMPVINGWVEHGSVKAWLRELLKVSVTPLIHLLYSHGVALESHAQNMILLHRQGHPVRVALKDFHDGVRFIPDDVSHASLINRLAGTPESHLQQNRSSYIHAEIESDVRDFLYSAFFSMNLSELALFLSEHYDLQEKEFWSITADCIKNYQRNNPCLADRFKRYDLFEEIITVEAHTRRRLQSENDLRVNRVKNPLHRFNDLRPGGSVNG